MKRAPMKPSGLSESLHRRLNSYALAASAAGVGLLVLTQPTEAKIIYSHDNVKIGPNTTYGLEINHDVVTVFSFSNVFSEAFKPESDWAFAELAVTAGAANGVLTRAARPARLNKNARIGPKGKFGTGKGWMYRYYYANGYTRNDGTRNSGSWINGSDGYLGLKFFIHGKAHYGWARLSVSKGEQGQITATLIGHAYETIANRAIIAGKTKGADVVTVQPASLGHLAHGASAISAWRSTGGNQ